MFGAAPPAGSSKPPPYHSAPDVVPRPAFRASEATPAPYASPPSPTAAPTKDEELTLKEAERQISQITSLLDKRNQQLYDLINKLQQSLEMYRQSYNKTIADRDVILQKLIASNDKLKKTEKVVKSFLELQNAIIASDGFTYPEEDIKAILAESASTGEQLLSNKTHEAILPVYYPNKTLVRLVESLKGFHSLKWDPPQFEKLPPPWEGVAPPNLAHAAPFPVNDAEGDERDVVPRPPPPAVQDD